MCGRFALDEKVNDLIADFVVRGNRFEDWQPSYSIAPTEVIPIVREHASRESGEIERVLERAVWDFHPSFMKDSKRPQFNSRIESVATNGLWKSAFASSRCIVPMRGYYEWTEREGKKWPHFLHGDGVLAAAGIYTTRKVGDDWELSTSIITREARDASGRIHDRMPVFLDPSVYDRWLDIDKLGDDAQKQDMVSMLLAVSDDVASTIRSHEVDRRVNNTRTAEKHDATLIEPVGAA